MASKDYFHGVVDAMIDTLSDNAVELGGVVEILERDEEPSVIAESPELLPKLVVEPLSNRLDSIRITCGDDELQHAFTMSVKGYYLFNNLKDDIRTMRAYAFDCFDLLRTTKQFGAGHVYGGSINPGYFVMVDNPIYKWHVSIYFKMIEP